MKNLKVNIITKKPWWWFVTGRPWTKKVATTIGRNIYCAKRPDDETLVHEEVHVRQHNGSMWGFWKDWFRIQFDNDYYFETEREAYQAQLDYIVKKYPVVPRKQIKAHIVKKMSSQLYNFDKKRVCESLA